MYLGTSIGIAVQENHLDVVCLVGRWRRLTVTGFLRIEDFRTRPVPEVAEQYRRFREENHALTSSGMVALPRGMGLVRTLELPAEVGRDLEQAVTYQVDSLHPFEEGSVYFDYAVLPESPVENRGNGVGAAKDAQGGRLRVAVALVEKNTLDQLYQWFCQAGIDIAGFTLSTAVLYQAMRGDSQYWGRSAKAGNSPGVGRPLVLLHQCGQSLEMLGIATDGAFYSKQVPATAPLQREVEFCAAELRLNREESPLLLWTGEGTPPQLEIGEKAAREGAAPAGARLEEGSLAATPEVRPAEFHLREHFVAYAAALPGLERRLPGLPWGRQAQGLRWNLLPPAKRIYRSHWAYTAAWALAVLVLLLGAAWAATGWAQDRLYTSWLNSQINQLKPRVQYVERLDSRHKALLVKLQLLQGQQQDIPHKLEAWKELTRLIPVSAWLRSLQFVDNQVTASGQAKSASGILQAINQSSYFEQPQFAGSIAKNAEGLEVFRIRMRLREMAVVQAGSLALSGAPAASVGSPARSTDSAVSAVSKGGTLAGASATLAPGRKGGS